MINNVRFTCTALAGKNLAGELKVDSEGYRTVVLGGLNVFNSAGEYYNAEGVKHLFESSGLLQKRISRGRLRGEYGHPKIQPGMTDEQFSTRVLTIDEKSVCVQFKEVYLDFENVRDANGRPMIAIVGRIIPSGPYGDALEKSLSNPSENVCFSVRAFTDDHRIRGINNRFLKTIVTWDYVNDPGISIAEKFHSPALEGLFEHTFTRGQIERGIVQASHTGIAQESAILTADELFTSMGWNVGSKPALFNW